VGIAPNSKRALQKDLRICGRHQFVNLRDTYKYETLELDESGNHKAKSTTDDFWVPASKGEKAVTTTSSKGLGVDRFQAKLLSEIATESWTAATQQCSQLSDESAPELSQVNESVLKSAGLDVHVRTERRKRKEPPKMEELPDPVILPSNMSDNAVKLHTGFPSLFILLAFVVILCDGSIATMTEKVTNLTWFEEWIVYFEWVWGRETLNLESIANKYGASRRTIVCILDKKLTMGVAVMQRWPRFASFEEDFPLRSQRWKDKYGQRRVIFWDDTNVNASDPSDADMNRAWFSFYYGSCVAKGAVFLQL